MARFAAKPGLLVLLTGLATTIAVAGLILFEPDFAASTREAAIDAVSQAIPAPVESQVLAVDIDETSVKALGNWPWPRSQLAQLIGRIAAGKPAAVALDFVLNGRCGTADPGNAELAAALAMAPATIGFVLSGQPDLPPAVSPVALRQPVALPDLWHSAGAELPCPEFMAVAGLSTVSLAGDGRASVRTVPAIAGVGQDLYPGLATDVLRLAAEAGSIIVTGLGDPVLSAGDLVAHMDSSGGLRLHASRPSAWAARTITAADALTAPPERFAGKIVFIGSSLPQLGGLRPTAASPLTPSLQIHADIASSMLAGHLPWRPAIAGAVEAVALLLAALLAILAVLRLPPMAAAAVTLALAGLLCAMAVIAYRNFDLAFDPLLPPLGLLATGIASGLSQYSAARAAAAAIRLSFEQRLPPAIVARLVKAGAGLKLEGEERVVTALFTDIEDFTAMTAAAGPRELIRMLDGYFEGITRIVIKSGGMIDKIVGDAVHAFFNMPLDLPGHQAKALACAEAIVAFADDYRNRPDVKCHGFGRTRIGIETGPVVTGDVGVFGKIDYTAYGNTVNLAARLQEANKQTGTTILAGPGLKASCPEGWILEPHGSFDVRGRGPMEIFVPRRAAKD